MIPDDNRALPLISIGMPVYNGAGAVQRALDSLLAQDYQNFELIISDNASTDSTWDILQEYAARDSRIKLFRNERNRGMAYNFNRVFELAQGVYFMWAAHDDRWETGFIGTCLQHLEANPASVACYSGDYPPPVDRIAQMASDDPWTRVQGLVRGWAGSSVAMYGLFRRDMLSRAMPLLSLEAPDGVMLLQLAIKGPLIYFRMPLHQYHIGRRNTLIRMKSMGRTPTVWNLLRWDAELAWAMVRAVWRGGTDVSLGLRLRLTGTALAFAGSIFGWPYPMRVISRYVAAIVPLSAFYPVIARLHRHPRLLDRLRRLTGLYLSAPPDV